MRNRIIEHYDRACSLATEDVRLYSVHVLPKWQLLFPSIVVPGMLFGSKDTGNFFNLSLASNIKEHSYISRIFLIERSLTIYFADYVTVSFSIISTTFFS